MKIAAIILLSLLLIFLGVQIFSFVSEEHQLSANLNDVRDRLLKAKQDEDALQRETAYLANPTNLEKELRSRFNYKNPGEKMIIIVPAQSSTTSTGE